MSASPGRHARHQVRALALALGLTAGMVIAAGMLAAAVTLAGMGTGSPVPGPQPHAAAPAHHAPSVHLPEDRKPARRVVVTVRPGECLSSIAVAHGVTWRALYRANRAVVGSNPGLIMPGMRLRIPVRGRR